MDTPPPAKNAIRKARATTALRRDMAISSRMGLGAWTVDQYKPGWGAGQGIFGAILIDMDKQDRQDLFVCLERLLTASTVLIRKILSILFIHV